MSELKDLLPKNSLIVNAIYSHYKRVGDEQKPREYLGASIIGHPCERYLWYTFRHCCRPDFDGRMYRLFDTGNHEEARLVADLRAIGCEVHGGDEAGQQFAVSAVGGHFSGHMDGCVLGVPGAEKTWHVAEFKTHNSKSFSKLQKEGVEKSKPQHYTQMQVYMHLSGMTRALYLAVNKDTDELYAERVRHDKQFAESMIERAERIIDATTPPERISDRPDFWQCQFCEAKSICFGIQADGKYQALPVPFLSCRQCCHATPTADGNACWKCEKHKRGLSFTDQQKSCRDHLCLPGLFSYSDPTDYGDNYIEYTTKEENKKWRNGNEGKSWSSDELTRVSMQQVYIGYIAAAKDVFDLTVEGVCQDDILHRYPAEDSEIVWHGRYSKLEEAWKDKYKDDLSALAPLLVSDAFEYKAAEYNESRVVIFWPDTKEAEIRQGKS